MKEIEVKDIETIREEHAKGFNIMEVIQLYVSHWYWFVLTVFVTLCYGVYQIMSIPPTYTETIDLLIKSEKGTGGMKDFERLGVTATTSSLNNEIYTLKTTQLMEKVVRSLKLDLQYSVKHRFRTMPLYQSSPIDVYFSSYDAGSAFSFTVKLINKNEALIYEQNNSNKLYRIKLDKWCKSPFGNLMIKTNDKYASSWDNKEIFVTKYNTRSLAGSYVNRMYIKEKGDNTSILSISINDEVPRRADDILLSLVRVYNENWLYDKNLMAEATSNFIEERLQSVTQELNNVDSSVADFKSENLVSSDKGFGSRYEGRAESSYNRIYGLNNNLTMSKYLKNYLVEAGSSNKFDLLPVNAVASESVNQLINNYNSALLKRKEIIKNSNINAPIVAEYTEKIVEMRNLILQSLNNEIAQIEKQIQDSKREENMSNAMIAMGPHKESQLSGIARRQKVLESLYTFLLQKREENDLSKAYTAANSRIIEAPYGPGSPTSPDRRGIMSTMLIIGLSIPALLLFFLDYMDNTLRGRGDLKGYSIPLLGELPNYNKKRRFWQKKKKESRMIVVKPGSRDRMNEAFRMLRTKLSFFLKTVGHEKGKAKVVMLTSFNPSSGKTFISSNLAVALGLSGKKVLLIDMDIRRSSLTKMLPSRPKEGLTNYLSSDDLTLDSIIIKDAFQQNVDLIPSGVKAPNPTELLSSPRLKVMFERIEKEYDYIFLDCPPIEIVADATIIKDYADVTIFIARVGLMDRRSLPELEYMYQSDKYNQLCVLVNGANFVNGSYGRYRYGYGYSYGYSYGYGNYGNYYDS